MTTRRQFITSASAAIAGLSAGPALAQGWTVPQDFMPRLIQHGREYYAPGEVHVEPTERRLYWVLNDGYAIRYTVGIGRAGLYESGDFTIGAKKEWPSWTPTPDMIERDPDSYEQYADGMPGGPENPLGARALYSVFGQSRHLPAHPRHQRALDDQQRRVQWLRAAGEFAYRASLYPGSDRNPGGAALTA